MVQTGARWGSKKREVLDLENFVIYTKVADTGQDIYAFDVPFKGNISQKDVHLSDNFLDSSIDNFLAMKPEGYPKVYGGSPAKTVFCA